MSLSRRLATAPWPVFVLLMLAVGAVTLGLLTWVYSGPDDPDTAPLLAVVFLVAAVVTPVVAVVRRRRLQAAGRWEAVLDAVDAFQQRRVPDHPAARAELARMAAQQRSTLWVIRWGWLLFAALAALAVAGALDEPREWVMVALFGGLAAAYPLLHRRVRSQVDAAERAVGGPPVPPGGRRPLA